MLNGKEIMKHILTICAVCMLLGVQVAKADVGEPFKNCALMAEDVLASGQKDRDGRITVVVEKDVCIKAESYNQFVIGDAKRWSVHVIERDENGKAIGHRISPLEKGITTDLVLLQQDGITKSLILVSAH